MAVAGAGGLRVEPVGNVSTLLARLRAEASGGAVALGVDFPIGVPRGYAALHGGAARDFPAFLRGIGPGFMQVCAALDDVSAARPFYPMRGVRGMTRLARALALGLPDAVGQPGLALRALLDDPKKSDGLLARLPDSRWKAAAATLNLRERGVEALRDPKVQHAYLGN